MTREQQIQDVKKSLTMSGYYKSSFFVAEPFLNAIGEHSHGKDERVNSIVKSAFERESCSEKMAYVLAVYFVDNNLKVRR